jgi:NAD+ synthase (glutamine-hydrolysing)
LLGCESGRIIFDGDTLIAANGEIVARGPRFSYQDVVVIAATIDVDRTRLSRFRQASFVPHLTHDGRCVTISGFKIGGESVSTVSSPANWEESKDLKHEEFWRAIALGLFDYLRKSRSEGFVVSLSGGVDSSAASCLVSMMVHSAVKDLGKRGFKEKLPFVSLGASSRPNTQLMQQLLACVYQGTENSSTETRTAAREVARELGATYIDLDISGLVDGYEKLISKATGTKLTWKEHDIARQNIQARVRSPSVWLVANLRRALLLSTSNRSEAAVGYTTMDGDSSGGLSPLGGIDKAYLREWLRWLETTGPADLELKYPSLRLVNAQAPTAELRPLKEKQTDEGDLMPYRVLDKIERYAIRDRCLPTEVFLKIASDFSGEFKREDLSRWTARFFTLWSANQWKRERYAPSFHLDDENLDPKTWCRFPILSGGFKEELLELARLR